MEGNSFVKNCKRLLLSSVFALSLIVPAQGQVLAQETIDEVTHEIETSVLAPEASSEAIEITQPATAEETEPVDEAEPVIEEDDEDVAEPTLEPEAAELPAEEVDEAEEVEENLAPDMPEVQTYAATAADKITLDEETIYMTNEHELVIPVELTPEEFSKLQWTFDGKNISEYMQWNMKTGKWDSTNPLVTVVQEKDASGKLVTKVRFATMFGSDDLELRWPHNIRRTYPEMIGQHEVKAVNPETGQEISLPINYRPYENYMSYDETMKAIEEIKDTAKDDRYVSIETIGKSTLGKDIRMGIIADSRQSIDTYLNKTTPMMLTSPDELIKLIQSGNFDYRVPVFFNNTHADEQPGIDIVRGAFERFAHLDVIKFNTLDDKGQVVEKELKVSDVLKNVIMLFNFVENPDGMDLNTRATYEGFDPNRDSSYQTMPETRAVIEQINKYNPLTFLDFHGFVKEFLIEPCTAPHDPNFEYDLLYKNMLAHAKAMGNAGISNSVYDSYLIPALDWEDGWDDAFSGYTGVYAVYQGILGHTIEVPGMNDHSFFAGVFAGMGSIDYVMNHRDQLFIDKLNIFLRGINKEENPETEKYFVDSKGNVVGRIKGDNPKFFPDYYVIPMSLEDQKNPQAAFDMIEYFRRNGVIVSQLTENVGQYKAGDLVINMAQAKRGYANHVLYKGSNESTFAAMYAELLVNFPQMRGFNSYSIFNDGLFDNKLGEVTHTQAPRSKSENKPYFYVKNNSLEAIQAINDAIQKGEKVYMAPDGYYIEKATFDRLIKDYALVAKGICAKPMGDALKPIKVYAPGNPNADLGFPSKTNAYWALKQMGFQVVETAEEADAFVFDGDDYDPALLGKKPSIFLGGDALRYLEESGLLKGLEVSSGRRSRYEGLLKAVVNKASGLASGYEDKDLIYSNSSAWLSKLPEGFLPILKTSAGHDFFIAGWWPNNDDVRAEIMAADGLYEGQPVFLFAGNPLNKRHPHYFYRWVANALWRGTYSSLEEVDCPNEEVPVDPELPDNDVEPSVPELPEVELPEEPEVPETPETPEVEEPIEIEEEAPVAPIVAEAKTQSANVLPATGEADNMAALYALAAVALAGGLVFTYRKQGQEN
ncbi:LPXTG-motif cell wall anchor domain-containing protein [Ignavigranum ruoffiae]|uniref:LPXTG-motif cell wall anchor domain-containing protein n=1 Tax=Ignavigranum ruoffiae TaxID=89093 RepID=A0A1H9F0B7_9LACT|nr:LPXTG cell wall anchor domain-containing protein [Ignavigranum ruoffiae]SEQ31307.1 LPXTG-motif cell wall anchor domain-containing protein [Ignavigranum ruoffiae]